MNQTDQSKVLDAGFTIVRERDVYGVHGVSDPTYHIYAKTKEKQEWHKLEGPFKSKAARDRRMKELMLNRKNVID